MIQPILGKPIPVLLICKSENVENFW